MAEIPNPFEVQAEPTSPSASKFQSIAMKYKDTPYGTPLYLKLKGEEGNEPTTGATIMKLGHYANPELAQHSSYFSALDQMMQCVEKNAGVTDPAA